MSTLEILGISGFRSYSTETLQKIQFKKPLTLIWGKNGSGKTTIIEALKYITTGALPPSCQKGKNFIMQPRIMGKTEIMGEVRLKFRAFNDRPVLATRRALLTINQKGSKFESIEQILKTKDENGQMIQINHQCAQIQKQIPILLGSSKPILEKIVFCHQDESLWPFEDSATLKSIFDELFQTKKYTQVIEGLWEQRKEYQKKIGEIKKALPYLQRLYEQDKRRKIVALSQMEDVNKQTINVRSMKDELERMQVEMRQTSQESKIQKKFQLGRQRKAFEEKFKNNCRIIQQCRGKAKKLKTIYLEMNGTELVFDLQRSKNELKEISPKLNSFSQRYDQLKIQLNCLQAAQAFSQKQLQLSSQLANAKQFLPECKKQNLSDDKIYKKLTLKQEYLQGKKKQLLQCRQSLEKCSLPSTILQVLMNEQQYLTQKSNLSLMSKNAVQLKQNVIKMYVFLYKPVNQKQLGSWKEQNYYDKLTEIQYRLKIKKQQLQLYQKMPKQCPNTQQKIFKLRFLGIEFYQGYIEYCTQKHKCSLCSKPVSEEDLKLIHTKSEKMKEKTLKQIGQLEKQLAKQGKKTVGVNPEAMIPKLIDQIQKGEAAQKWLSQKVKDNQKMMQLKEQARINLKLKEGLKLARLQDEIEKMPNQSSSKSNGSTLQEYLQTVKKYRQIENEINRKKGEISRYEEQVKRNKEAQIKSEEIRNQRKILGQKIAYLEEETKNLQIISRICRKLSLILKQKENQPSMMNTYDKKSKQSVKQLNQQMFSIERTIKCMEILKQFYEFTIHFSELQAQNIVMEVEMNKIDSQMIVIETELKQFKSKNNQCTNLKVQYQKKQREVDLRAEMAFQEYYKTTEKDYLNEKSKLVDFEIASRDLQAYCAAIQNAISTIHKQKMDEVNKIIADIWQEIYHGSDISMIQILTEIEEDSKKRKNYHYSIMMQKTGANSAKVQMKGRCSMGQKVLASIVIRLALAEVFSSNARILALDEPTTYLDRQHINKLASELCRLIELNQGGSLQLLIISHDLQFIKQLEKYTTHYYQVTRDARQFSVITAKEIRQIFSAKNEF